MDLFSFAKEPNYRSSISYKNHVTKVVETLGVAVGKLNDLETLKPILY
jgi:hypothetical protein